MLMPKKNKFKNTQMLGALVLCSAITFATTAISGPVWERTEHTIAVSYMFTNPGYTAQIVATPKTCVEPLAEPVLNLVANEKAGYFGASGSLKFVVVRAKFPNANCKDKQRQIDFAYKLMDDQKKVFDQGTFKCVVPAKPSDEARLKCEKVKDGTHSSTHYEDMYPSFPWGIYWHAYISP